MTETNDWPFELSITVIFRDLDAMGHVNNAVYFTYMETARTTFFFNELNLADPQELSVIIAEATCTYHAPLRMGDKLRLQLGVSRISRRSFDIAYRMTADDGRLVALAKTVMVTYDYKKRQAVPIPGDLRSVLERFSVSVAVLGSR